MGFHEGVGGCLLIEMLGGKYGLGHRVTPYGETLSSVIGNVKYNIAQGGAKD
jgi:hypothetical protein